MATDAEDADTESEVFKDFQFDPNYELKLNKAWVETGVVCSMYATGNIQSHTLRVTVSCASWANDGVTKLSS